MKYCIQCGGPLPEGSSSWRKFCNACYRERRRQKERDRWAERKAIRESEQEKKPAKTIAEIAREAREHGMSYGQWVARVG